MIVLRHIYDIFYLVLKESREMNRQSNNPKRKLTEEQKKLRNFHRTLNILGNIYFPINPNYDSYLNDKHREGMRLLLKAVCVLADLDYDLN
jgi:hypothetical protein